MLLQSLLSLLLLVLFSAAFQAPDDCENFKDLSLVEKTHCIMHCATATSCGECTQRRGCFFCADRQSTSDGVCMADYFPYAGLLCGFVTKTSEVREKSKCNDDRYCFNRYGADCVQCIGDDKCGFCYGNPIGMGICVQKEFNQCRPKADMARWFGPPVKNKKIVPETPMTCPCQARSSCEKCMGSGGGGCEWCQEAVAAGRCLPSSPSSLPAAEAKSLAPCGSRAQIAAGGVKPAEAVNQILLGRLYTLLSDSDDEGEEGAATLTEEQHRQINELFELYGLAVDGVELNRSHVFTTKKCDERTSGDGFYRVANGNGSDDDDSSSLFSSTTVLTLLSVLLCVLLLLTLICCITILFVNRKRRSYSSAAAAAAASSSSLSLSSSFNAAANPLHHRPTRSSRSQIRRTRSRQYY